MKGNKTMKRNILMIIIVLGIVSILVSINSKKEDQLESLAVYVDNEYVSSIPKKGEAVFSKAICDDDIKVLWDNETWKLKLTNLKEKVKCNLYFVKYTGNTIFNFDYTGGEQTFTVPKNGTYKIELWGAQGGSTSVGTVNYSGGLGAYTEGIINLKEKQKLYLYVGEQGNCDTEYVSDTPTNKNEDAMDTWEYETDGTYTWPYKYYRGNAVWNNGAYPSKLGDGVGCTGGGSTDIRLVNGSWDDFNSLKSRIMVAASGSGAKSYHYSENGISAGGLKGYDGTLNGTDGTTATGASQIIGGTRGGGIHANNYTSGSFGKAGLYEFAISGGGNGYYGGGPGAHGSGTTGSGSSGSSFISGHNGCDAIKEESTEDNIIHTGQSIHYSGYYFIDTLMIDGNGYKWTNQKEDYTGMPSHVDSSIVTGNTGNGSIRITLLTIDE